MSKYLTKKMLVDLMLLFSMVLFIQGTAFGRVNGNYNPDHWRYTRLLFVEFNYPTSLKNPIYLVFIDKSIDDVRFENTKSNAYKYESEKSKLVVSDAVTFTLRHLKVKVNQTGVYVNNIRLDDPILETLVYSSGEICRGVIMWSYYSDKQTPSNVKRCYPPVPRLSSKKNGFRAN